MYEVEVKVPADHDRVRAALEDLGADRVGRVVQTDTYYDAPDRSFADTDEALRIREERAGDGGDPGADSDDGLVAITYKGPKVDEGSKTRREAETEVGNRDSAAAILDGLGYDPVATVRKERERFTVEGYTVTLDDVDGVGSYVEVEREGSEADVDRLREGAYDLLERLGLDPDDQVRESYLELLLERR